MFFLNHKTTQTKRRKLKQQQQKVSKIKIEKNEYIKVYIMLIKFDFCVCLDRISSINRQQQKQHEKREKE